MTRKIILFVLVAILTMVMVVPAGAEGAPQSYLVMAKNDKMTTRLLAKLEAVGGTIDRLIPEIGMAVVSSSSETFAADAKGITGIGDVVPNLVVQWVAPVENVALGAEAANPPFSGDDDFFFDLQWGHDAVDAPEAWDLGFRGAGVVVAVLDGGFDLTHPDLVPNINFALSKDFTGEGLQYALLDPFSHGSHTAGTIAAADNGYGTIGVAPEAELVLVKVLGDAGTGSFADVISGIVYAANVDADVISMSLGATFQKNEPGASGLLVAIGKATTYAYQQGSIVIAAAGNDAIDFDHTGNLVHTPSSAPHVLSISATAPIGWAVDPANAFLSYLASYSNYGQSAIDFAAPGGDYSYAFVDPEQICSVAGIVQICYVLDFVFSTGNGGWYWSAGTSMAAPHAAGVAALIIGANGGDMKPAHVEAAMRSGALDLGKPGNDDAYGHGLVNAYESVK